MNIELIIFSNFLSFIIIEAFNLSSFLKFTRINFFVKIHKFKLFKCLPCFTFWSALSISFLYHHDTKTIFLNAAAAYLLAIFIDNR